jgi:hypothetical protein
MSLGSLRITFSNTSASETWHRMAPEYLRRKTEYNTSCDIYAFGKSIIGMGFVLSRVLSYSLIMVFHFKQRHDHVRDL